MTKECNDCKCKLFGIYATINGKHYCDICYPKALQRRLRDYNGK